MVFELGLAIVNQSSVFQNEYRLTEPLLNSVSLRLTLMSVAECP